MGLFWRSKTKLSPRDFVKNQVDALFSPDFINAERNEFGRLSKENAILQRIDFNQYLRERQNVISRLFEIAWCQIIPESIFIENSQLISDDPRVKALDTGAYDRVLSRAQEAGTDTFGFISREFLTQILPGFVDPNDGDYKKLYVIFGTDFTGRYINFEALIKRHKFL